MGSSFNGKTITDVNVFDYQDPVDGSVASNQGVRVLFEDQSRIVLRKSGTGTDSATIRVYLEQIENDASKQSADAIEFNESLGQFANQLANIEKITGNSQPTVKT